MFWNNILNNVINKKNDKNNKKNKDKELSVHDNANIAQQIEYNAKKNYYLGSKYQDIYFTQRETECMIMLIKGKTINKIAKELQLSPRTIEFYLKNMKNKIGCRTKFELIEQILESDFLLNLPENQTEIVNQNND